MGNASSTNVAKIITDVHAKVATSILQKQDVTQNNSQIIKIVGSTGDVNITNNTFKIKATVDMVALQTAMSDSSAKSAIKNQLEQAAKTLTTGISLLQFTDARNTLDLFVKTGTDLSTAISQSCGASQTAVQSIELENVKGGNVNVSGNVFEQMASIYSNCAQNAVASNAVVQDIQNKVDQATSATVEGTSLVALAAVGVGFFSLPVLIPVVAASAGLRSIFRFLFPLLILASVFVFAFYFTRVSYTMTSYGYAPSIDQKCPGSSRKGPSLSSYTEARQAEAACLADEQCLAYDFRANAVSGSLTSPLPSPLTTLYTGVASGCREVTSASTEAGNATDSEALNAVGFKNRQRSTLLLVISLGLLFSGVVGTIYIYRSPAAAPAAP